MFKTIDEAKKSWVPAGVELIDEYVGKYGNAISYKEPDSMYFTTLRVFMVGNEYAVSADSFDAEPAKAIKAYGKAVALVA